MRLIVEDAAGKRGFRIGAGRLRVGRGADARLKLDADGVAELHAELEISDGGALLTPLEGAEVLVDGVAITEATSVAFDQVMIFGAAQVRLEDEGATEASAAAPAVAAAPKSVVRARKSSTAAGRARGSSSSSARSGRSRGGSRSARKASPAKPLLMALAGVVVLGFAGWKLFSSTPSTNPDLILQTAENMLQSRERTRLTKLLDSLPPAGELSAAQRARLEKIRSDFANQRSSTSEAGENVAGFRFFDEKVMRYHAEHIEGQVDVRKARYFLELCAEFRERWPTHPELEWIDAEQERLAVHASLDSAPTLPQLDWCVKSWTGGSPKRFVEAFRLVDQFLDDCGADCAGGEQMRDRLEAEREAYYDTTKKRAQTALDDGKEGLAAGYLIGLIVDLGDSEMCDRSARALLRVPNAAGYLRTVRDEDRYRYKRLSSNPVIREFAQKNGLL